MMTETEYKANERYFIQMMRMTKMYTWIEKGNIYDMNGKKIQPTTLKAYVELAGIVRKPFMEMFVELPTDCDWDKDKVWAILDELLKKEKTKSKSRSK